MLFLTGSRRPTSRLSCYRLRAWQSRRSPFLSLANPENTDSFLGPSEKFAYISNSPSKPKSNSKNAYPQLLHFIFRLDSLLSILRHSAQYKTCSIHPYLPAAAQYFPNVLRPHVPTCGRTHLRNFFLGREWKHRRRKANRSIPSSTSMTP